MTLKHMHNQLCYPLLENSIIMKENTSVNPESHLFSYKAHWLLASI
jgi:hypothetical protein